MKEQPNNWLAVYETPHEFFPEVSYDDFYEFHIANWMLPSSHECIIRATNLKTKKVTEYNYRYRKAAENKIKKLLATHEFVVCDHEAIHKLSPHPQRYNTEESNTRYQTS